MKSYRNMSEAKNDLKNILKIYRKRIEVSGTIEVGLITDCCPGISHPLLLDGKGKLSMDTGWY